MNDKKIGISISIVLLTAIIIGLVFFLVPKKDAGTVYKVTFDNDGVTEVIEVKKTYMVSKPKDPTKEGFTFEGWYYNGTKFDFSTRITEDITLVARWTETALKKWIITFDTDGGNDIESLNVVDGRIIDEIPTPTKEGYEFVGWYYNNKKFDFSTKVTSNITLEAKWEKSEQESEHTVKFDANGGSSVKSQVVDHNETVTKPSSPTRKGYKFIGWYYNNKKFDFSTKITSDITLEAKWEKTEQVTKYKVKFDTDGGSTISEQKVQKGKKIVKPKDPTKEGYEFIGWYYNGVEYNFDTKVTTNMTLEAKWEEKIVISYKIEKIEKSYVGQVRIFVLKNNEKVDGIVSITTTNGKVVEKEISKDGYITNGDVIESINNVRVK